MAGTPSGPPSKDVTAMDWADVTRFADDIKQLLDGLTPVAGQLSNQNAFAILPGSFVDAKSLATASTGVGSSMQGAVTWMERLLTDVHAGLANAVKSLGNTESLQQSNAQKLLALMQNINTDLGSSPSGGTGGTGGGSSTPLTTG